MTGDAVCARCQAGREVTWCPAWQQWLCPGHRHERAWRELDATESPDGWAEAVTRPVTLVPL